MPIASNPVERAWNSDEHRAYAVAIVGGGFAGVMTAIHLLRVLPAPSEIVLFERGGRLGGAAYGTELPCHLLNVPAARMSAFPDAPADFADWLSRSGAEPDCAATDAGLFAPRALYGAYIESLAREALRSGRLAIIPVAVTDLQPDRGGFRLAVADGRAVRAMQVVLALGNLPAGGMSTATHVRDPWSPAALAPLDQASDRPVVIVGTGLSMVDLSLGLRARGFSGRIVAISRRGLLPQRHRPGAASWPTPDFTPVERRSILGLLRRVRAEIAAAAAADVDWRGVIDGVRPAVQSLWQGLPLAERRRFLRHVRPWWDIHRHRTPKPAADAIAAMREQNWLQVHAGSVLSIDSALDGARVTWRPRGTSTPVRIDAARVIVATGAPAAAVLTDPLLRALCHRGLARLDGLGLGLEVNGSLDLMDASGRPNPAIHALGPIVRGVLWECTAVPELRVQAASVARRVADALQPADA